jgi:serine/threonine-protein kinase
MERLEGETVAARLRRTGQMPFGAAADILLQVLAGLSAAHAAQVVHRDVKPSNVFVSERAGATRKAMLLDFGYARNLASMSRITGPGRTVGTPAYMAPEVLRGEDATPLTDIFGCGALLFEMLTGEHAFRGKTEALLHLAILRGNERSLRDIRPDVDEEVAALVHCALSSDPWRRPPSAADFEEALRRLVNRTGRAARSSAPGPSDPIPRLDSVAPPSSAVDDTPAPSSSRY